MHDERRLPSKYLAALMSIHSALPHTHRQARRHELYTLGSYPGGSWEGPGGIRSVNRRCKSLFTRHINKRILFYFSKKAICRFVTRCKQDKALHFGQFYGATVAVKFTVSSHNFDFRPTVNDRQQLDRRKNGGQRHWAGKGFETADDVVWDVGSWLQASTVDDRRRGRSFPVGWPHGWAYDHMMIFAFRDGFPIQICQ